MNTHSAIAVAVALAVGTILGDSTPLSPESSVVRPVDMTSTNRIGHFRSFGSPPSAAEMRARFEEMREKDPSRYTQMTNNMAQWRARRQKRLQNQLNFLANANTNHMTKAQREVHETYQKLLVRQEELHELMALITPNVTNEQRDTAFKEMREISHKLMDLRSAERDTLLSLTVHSFGIQNKQAQEAVSAIKAVYEATGNSGSSITPVKSKAK